MPPLYYLATIEDNACIAEHRFLGLGLACWLLKSGLQQCVVSRFFYLFFLLKSICFIEIPPQYFVNLSYEYRNKKHGLS